MMPRTFGFAMLVPVLVAGLGLGQLADRAAASERVKVPVPEGIEAQLAERGFAAQPQRGFDTLARMYRWWKHKHYPVIVTTDAALHTAHLYFDWYLRYLEAAYLRDDLLNLTDALITRTMQLQEEAQAEKVNEAALLAACYLVVGKRLLTGDRAGPAPEPWQEKMEGELELIRKAERIALSPLFGCKEDYTQYKPRGHYARSEELSSYFRAMAWFGRMSFRLTTPDAPERARQQTRCALLLCRALQTSPVKGEEALDVWRRIYETTAFFAGRSDDLLPTDYIKLSRVYAADPVTIALESFMKRARNFRKPSILGTWELSEKTAGGSDWPKSTAGMRLFGRRYSLDGEIMQQLTFDSVMEYQGDPEPPLPFTCVNARGMLIRGFPRGLDVIAALGFDEAYALLEQEGDTDYAKYEKRFEQLTDTIVRERIHNAAPATDLAVARLRALTTLFGVPVGRLPKAMQRPEWKRKQLAAALGSWTELKHDTILYTKHPYAAMQMALAGASKGGPTPPPPPAPHGYVEPRPDAFAAVRAPVKMLVDRIKALGYPEDRALIGRIESFAGDLQTLEDIADKELHGETLSEEEFAFIENIGSSFRIPRGGFPHYRDVDSEFRTEMDDLMPIVADVFTDPNSGHVLEEAVGPPMILYMVCPVDGRPEVCVGAIYSYYEFKRPMAERLTDEEWRELLKRDEQHPMPAWMNAYVVEED